MGHVRTIASILYKPKIVADKYEFVQTINTQRIHFKNF